jgi:hypothetical protein
MALEECREELERPDYASMTILPLLYRNLVRYEQEEELRSRLRGMYRWSWHRNQLLVADVAQALGVLRRARVETLLMKGVPLALRYYDDLGVRVMGDADVVVRTADVPRALAALESAGWEPERRVTEDVLWSLAGINVRSPHGRIVDLNWHILPDSYDAALDDAFWRGSDEIEVGAETTRSLAPADHLLLVIAHGLSWSANSPLHWAADATVLLRRDPAFDWERLVDLAERSRRAPELRAGLEFVIRVLDARVPARALERIGQLRIGIRHRTAFWFAERSGPGWVWGRAPVVAASYVRSSRARGRTPGPLGFLRFAAARADCSPGQWIGRAASAALHHVSSLARKAGRDLLPQSARKVRA